MLQGADPVPRVRYCCSKKGRMTAQEHDGEEVMELVVDENRFHDGFLESLFYLAPHHGGHDSHVLYLYLAPVPRLSAVRGWY
jgi:hypothetical protein